MLVEGAAAVLNKISLTFEQRFESDKRGNLGAPEENISTKEESAQRLCRGVAGIAK